MSNGPAAAIPAIIQAQKFPGPSKESKAAATDIAPQDTVALPWHGSMVHESFAPFVAAIINLPTGQPAGKSAGNGSPIVGLRTAPIRWKKPRRPENKKLCWC